MGKSDVEKTKLSSKSKKEKILFSTKVVIRRLPPSLKEEKLKECLGVLPEYDFFYFVDSQLSFGPVLFSRAYINFKNPDDIIKFRDEFDGYVFTDERGQTYPAVVEYAPYQGIPKQKNRKDPKCGTIEQDKDYLAFLASLEKEVEPLPSIEAHLEEIESRKEKVQKKTTPLLEYLKMKRSSRGGSRLGIGKKRHEKEETPKTLKKNTPPNKDSKMNVPREEKNKDVKKSDNRETSRRDQGRKDDDRKHAKDSKDFSSDKDTKQQRNQRERDGKNRPDSSRSSSRADDRRHGNRRDRRDSVETSKGRDDRGRRYNDRYTDDRRRDNRPGGQKDSKASPREESSAKGRGKETKEENVKARKLDTKEEPEKKSQAPSRGSPEKTASREQEKDCEAPRKKESEREKDLSRVKNKDRPDRAIYQPRPRNPRSDSDQQGKDAKSSPDKGRETVSKEKDQESQRKEIRERDIRDKNRDRNREKERDRRSDRGRDKGRDRDREREPNRDQDKTDRRERDRERDRERARRKDRDRRDRDRDRAPKEQRNNEEVAGNKAESQINRDVRDE